MTFAFPTKGAISSLRLRSAFAAPLLALALTAMSVTASIAAMHPDAEGPDITGVYWIQSYSSQLQTIDGGDPPFTPEARAIYEQNMVGVADNTLNDPARHLCVPDGIPRVLQSPYPFEIVQTPGQIHFLYEINHIIRLIWMNQELPPEEELLYLTAYSGRSVGHWEGDTLVVESAGFKPGIIAGMDTQVIYLDNSGAPHSYQLSTTERYRMINADELEVIVTVHDPGVFTEDFQTRYVYDKRPDIRIMDYNCGEPHRDISGVPGVQMRQ